MKKIIFIDDDENVLSSFRRSFRTHENSWKMFFENSSETALEVIEREKVDLIVTDYKMPVLSGIDLLEKCRKMFPSVKTIMLSGQSENEVFEKAKNITDRYISKPCDLKALEKEISALLE